MGKDWKAGVILVITVRGRPGYLFGTKLTGSVYVPAKKVTFWVRSGDGMFKDILEGKYQIANEGYKNREYL